MTGLYTAFDLVPRATEVKPGRFEPFSYECCVRVSLVISIEIQGDVRTAVGVYANATTVCQEARETVAPCQTASNSSQSQSDDQNQSDNKDQSSSQNQSSKQGQSGDRQQSDSQPDSPVDQSKERVEDKKQKTKERSQGQGDQQQDQQDKGLEDQQGRGSKGQQANSSPGPSPLPNPYEGETPEKKQRHEELQHKNSQCNKNQRDKKDGHRSGNPNDAW